MAITPHPSIRFLTPIFAAMTIVAGLSSCSNIVTVRRPDVATAVSKAHEGIVVLSVTSNTRAITGFNSVWLAPTQATDGAFENRGTVYELAGLSSNVNGDTAVFIGSLPAGDYVIRRIAHHKFGRVRSIYVEPPQTETSLGTFSVHPGQVIDLGRLWVTPVGQQVIVGRSRQVDSNETLLKRAAPEYAGFYQIPTIRLWNSVPNDHDNAEALALAYPTGAAALTELEDGTVAAASRAGSILLRDATGHWQTVNCGILQSLLAIAPDSEPDELLVAGGEFDTLLMMDKHRAVTTVDTQALPVGDVVFIGHEDGKGWYVAVQSTHGYALYQTNSLRQPNWSLLVKLSESAVPTWTWLTPKGVAYTQTGAPLHFYDSSNGNWRSERLPGGGDITASAVSPANTIGIVTPSGFLPSWLFAQTFLSRDGGSSWTQIPSAFDVNAGPIYRTPDGLLLEAGGLPGHARLQASADGGQIWTTKAPDFDDRDHLWMLPTAGLFRITEGNTGVVTVNHSTDEGGHWVTETSNAGEVPSAELPLADIHKQYSRR